MTAVEAIALAVMYAVGAACAVAVLVGFVRWTRQ